MNQPEELAKVLPVLQKIQEKFNSGRSARKISLADLIVLGGSAAIEEAAKRAGHAVTVPFKPGRTDASQEMTDVQSIGYLEPKADGFRNYLAEGNKRSAAELLIDRADLLALTAPEMTVLVGGMRVLNTNVGNTKHGVFTDKPGTLSNDFFVNLLDQNVTWKKAAGDQQLYEGHTREGGALRWTASAVDLAFGSNSQLRAISEVYAADDAKQRFVTDFVAVWNKVMNLDRTDRK